MRWEGPLNSVFRKQERVGGREKQGRGVGVGVPLNWRRSPSTEEQEGSRDSGHRSIWAEDSLVVEVVSSAVSILSEESIRTREQKKV